MTESRDNISANSSFERLASAVCIRGICRRPQDTWRVESPDSLTVSEAMQRLLKGTLTRANLHAPVLLLTELFGSSQIPIMESGFPYGVWFPDRAAGKSIQETSSGEYYLEYEDLEDEWLDNGAGMSVAEFSGDKIIGGDTSVLELISRDERDLHWTEALLVPLARGNFGVLTLEDLLQNGQAKACWLSLALDLERSSLEFLKQNPIEALQQLSKKRFRQALKHREQRERAVSSKRLDQFRVEKMVQKMIERFASPQTSVPWIIVDLLEHTMLSDKKTMVCALATRLGLTKSRVKRGFEIAEALRNWSAHPTSVPELEVRSLTEFRKKIAEVLELTLTLEKFAGYSSPIEGPLNDQSA